MWCEIVKEEGNMRLGCPISIVIAIWTWCGIEKYLKLGTKILFTIIILHILDMHHTQTFSKLINN
jgi:hypothetical protein